MKEEKCAIYDNVFDQRTSKPQDFTFNKTVVQVFDDMVNRSVPMYQEIQRMICELAKTNVQEDSNIYDLGCSTGTTLLQLDKLLPEKIDFYGLDDSAAMIENLRRKSS